MILSIVGARPQFIKAAVVSQALRRDGVEELLVHTGQHYDANMSAVFFDELRLPVPHRNLAVGSGSHGAQTAAMLERLEQVMIEQKPAAVLIYGDTNSTLAGALAAAKLGIRLAHVEAGLRSFRRAMPEEINRAVADRLADIHFAPTATAVRNLASEGISGPGVHLVGDVMLDAALHFAGAANRSGVLQNLALERAGYVLATVHRAENTDDPARLRAIFEGLLRVAPACRVVVPLHPRTRQTLSALKLDTGSLTVIPPVGYLDMLQLLQNAGLVVTDSGGVQKEAYFCRTPCLTVRDETEWLELLKGGWNRLVPPTSAGAVESAIRDALTVVPTDGVDYEVFGGGRAALRIAGVLRDLGL